MKRWIFRLLALGVVTGVAYWVYDARRAGLFSLPDLPDGAYYLSFKSGFRAIVLDAEVPDRFANSGPAIFRSLGVANRERKYLGVPLEVQPWFKDAWSWCKSPTPDERSELENMPDDFKAMVRNARFDAVCRIDVDGVEVVRGLIFSVPRL